MQLVSFICLCHLLSVTNHIKLTLWSTKLVKHFYCGVVHLLLLLLKPPFVGPLQPEMTPKVRATLATTNTSHPSTGASCSEIGQQPKHQRPTVNPSPIMPPVETQPAVQISVEHPNLATFLYGISSLLVSFTFLNN